METTYIPVDKCVLGVVYRLNARNLIAGVYNGKGGFIGIREKFGNYYLDTEYHYDTSAHYGTAKPVHIMGVIPAGVKLESYTHPVCRTCSTPVEFIKEGETGWAHLGAGGAHPASPVSKTNNALYQALEAFESKAHKT